MIREGSCFIFGTQRNMRKKTDYFIFEVLLCSKWKRYINCNNKNRLTFWTQRKLKTITITMFPRFIFCFSNRVSLWRMILQRKWEFLFPPKLVSMSQNRRIKAKRKHFWYIYTLVLACLFLIIIILKSSWFDCYFLTDIYTCDITTRLLQDSFIMAFVIVNGKYKSTSNDRI